jgi:hypothetical protein
MSTDPWRDVAISLRWPDEERGPYAVEVRFHRGERWQAPGLSIDLLSPAEGRSLETADLRRLAMPAIAQRAYEKLVDHLQVEHAKALAAAPGAGDEQLDYRERLAAVRHLEEALEATRPRKAGRPPMARAALERIAEVYSAAYARGESPTQAVAAYLGCDKATAARRVALCRKRGVLLATGRGLAGGIPIPMRRVRAHDLDVLNLNKERGRALRTTAQEPDAEAVGDGEKER